MAVPAFVYAHRFIESWGAGEISGLHVGPCLESDLYAAYSVWVNRNGVEEVTAEKFSRICKSRDQKSVSAKLEWVLSQDESNQTELLVVRPTAGCQLPRGAKESVARYTGRSVHAFAAAAASGEFSLDFPVVEDIDQE